MAHSFVIALTVALFLLWFRYMCSLLLTAHTSLDRREDVAGANGLAFVRVLQELADAEASRAQLDVHVAALERDLEIVTYLLRHLGESALASTPAETRMLKLDYRFRCSCYSLIRHFSTDAAKRQTVRMAMIICHFADLIGERRTPACA